ncbi:hypothetical protein [Streptomyces sp. SP17KL33]|uniref:hypothetical protein n=1 Tax=Streptomyces sp. SP17KL33 TaxID=3002534 RepID=UPI002E75AA27|nr:hypothetical protein [Streptomyces sp. SP17KL33]MEE1838208.1 hypothetical protein [Streptomyces sp. SP17KL33]
MAATPYVTAAEFTAHPTFLDLDGLRSGVSSADAQTAELVNILLKASAWADGHCNQPLAAHQVQLRTQGRIDRDGNLVLFPADRPVLSVDAVSYGSTFTNMTTALAPVARVNRDQTILIPVGRSAALSGGRVYVDLTYTAGWVSTILAADAFEDASSLTVADPTGILPGASYRLWEPGAEETVTVASSYIPPPVTAPPAPTAVPLASPTLFAHNEGSGWSGMPADMRLAVVNYGVSLLMRPDTTAEDSYPDTSLSSSTRKNDSRRDGSGLVKEAERILNSYARRM